MKAQARSKEINCFAKGVTVFLQKKTMFIYTMHIMCKINYIVYICVLFIYYVLHYDALHMYSNTLIKTNTESANFPPFNVFYTHPPFWPSCCWLEMGIVQDFVARQVHQIMAERPKTKPLEIWRGPKGCCFFQTLVLQIPCEVRCYPKTLSKTHLQKTTWSIREKVGCELPRKIACHQREKAEPPSLWQVGKVS